LADDSFSPYGTPMFGAPVPAHDDNRDRRGAAALVAQYRVALASGDRGGASGADQARTPVALKMNVLQTGSWIVGQYGGISRTTGALIQR